MKSEFHAAAIARMAEVMPRMAVIVAPSDAAVVDEDAGAVHPDVGGHLAREVRPRERTAERVGQLEPLGHEVAGSVGGRLEVFAGVACHRRSLLWRSGPSVPADESIYRQSWRGCKSSILLFRTCGSAGRARRSPSCVLQGYPIA